MGLGGNPLGLGIGIGIGIGLRRVRVRVQIRSDRFEPPQPPRLGVWYGYCAHASDAEGFGQSGESCQRTGLKAGPRDWSGWALLAHIESDVYGNGREVERAANRQEEFHGGEIRFRLEHRSRFCSSVT